MGVIDSLPGGGEKFRTLSGSGNLKDKLKSAIRNNSNLSSLSDNQEAIIKAVRRYEPLIRQGKFGYSQRQNVLSQINRQSPLTADESLKVKKILQHLGKNVSASHALVNRDDAFEPEVSHFANQVHLANRSGLSSISSPDNARPVAQPTASASELRQGINPGFSNPTHLANQTTNPPVTPSRPPLIPLSR